MNHLPWMFKNLRYPFRESQQIPASPQGSMPVIGAEVTNSAVIQMVRLLGISHVTDELKQKRNVL
jgi:hypothetical protein